MKLFISLIFLASGLVLAGEGGASAEVPADLGIAPVSGEAGAAVEGLEMEEGVEAPYEDSGLTEAQKLYLDKKAQEDERVEQEDADSRQMEAEAEATAAMEAPYEEEVAPQQDSALIVE